MVSFGQKMTDLYVHIPQDTNKRKRRESIFQTRRVPIHTKQKNPPTTAEGYHLSPFLLFFSEKYHQDHLFGHGYKKPYRQKHIQYQRGSVTVETALALPLFLIVCIMLLSIVEVTRT